MHSSLIMLVAAMVIKFLVLGYQLNICANFTIGDTNKSEHNKMVEVKQ